MGLVRTFMVLGVVATLAVAAVAAQFLVLSSGICEIIPLGVPREP